MTTGPVNPGQKLIGLEVLRFLAALGVLVWHFEHFAFGGNFPVPGDSLPFHNVFAIFYAHGQTGVQLFWCISGFIFAWRYGAPIQAGTISFSRFMVLRFSRLYPLQAVTLIVLVLVQWAYIQGHPWYFMYQQNNLKHFLLNLVFAQYWGLQDGLSFNGPSWSISIEILVYVLFFGFSRLIGAGLWSALGVTAGLFVLGFAIHAAFGMIPELIFAAIFFYSGVITCFLHRLISPSRTMRIAAGVLSLIVIILLGYGVAVGRLTMGWTGTKVFPEIVIFPAMVVLVQVSIPDRFAPVNTVLTFLGDMTYSSYMVHFPLQVVVVMLLENLGIPMPALFFSPIFFLAYLLAVFVIARIMFRGFERPAQDWLRRLLLPRPVMRARAEAPPVHL